MTWAIFAQLVGSIGFPIVAIAFFAKWYATQDEKRRLDEKEDREKQRKDDWKRDQEYRQDCKEREATLNDLVKSTNETNTYILKANNELLESNKILMNDYKKDLTEIKRDVVDIKNELKIKQ